jgi:hypothetical protein
MDEVEKQIGETNRLLRFFKDRFIREAGSSPDNPPDWQDQQLTNEDADDFINSTVALLHNMASSFARQTDDPVYDEATQVANTLQTVLQKSFTFEPVDTQILSYSRMMERAGLVRLTAGDDGEQLIQFTPEGEQAIQSVRLEMFKHQAGDN